MFAEASYRGEYDQIQRNNSESEGDCHPTVGVVVQKHLDL
jgi:hypothetical protein